MSNTRLSRLERSVLDNAERPRIKVVWSPKKTQQLHPAFWLQSRRAPLELVTKQKPDGVWEGCCTGWEAESVISEVTFATELINVKLLNSPWPCEVHLLRIQVSE